MTLQREELQRLIARQDIEIEQMTKEIAELKSELDRLQKFLVDEHQSRNQPFEKEKVYVSKMIKIFKYILRAKNRLKRRKKSLKLPLISKSLSMMTSFNHYSLF